MLEANGADHKEYERKLREIEPILNQLSKTNINPQVVWLNQFSTFDYWPASKPNSKYIFSEKIHKYNSILQTVFRYVRYTIFIRTNEQ